MKIQRSPFTLNAIEFLAAILVCLISWSALIWTLQSMYNTWPANLRSYEVYWAETGSWLFQFWIGPLIFFLAISTISLVRALRGDVKHFSPLGHFALSFPLFTLPFLPVLGLVNCIVAISGLGLSFMVGIRPKAEYRGDSLAIFWNIVWTCLYGFYWLAFIMAYAD